MKVLERYKHQPPLPQTLWRNPLHFIAFGFGAGALPFAPGTFGTLMAIPFYLLLSRLPLGPYIFVVLLITVGSMFLSDKVAKQIKVHDHQGMCLDELVGYLVTMIAAPQGWLWICLGFLFFRFFDIFKPWPIRSIDEKVHGGFGIILDDVLAGVYSLICLQILARIF